MTFVVNFDGPDSTVDEAKGEDLGSGVTWSVAKRTLLAYLEPTRDAYVDAVKRARKLKKPKRN